MKTGIIAPIPHLEQLAVGDFHLILSHLLTDPDYARFYTQRARQGDHILLDNSAHEFQEGQPVDLLLQQAIDVGARELVCPDVLFSSSRTVERSREAMTFLTNFRDDLKTYQIQLMFVPQGDTIYLWGKCLEELVHTHRQLFPGQKFTIGISKDYEMFPLGTYNLIQRFVVPLRAQGISFDVHLLGWGRKLWQLGENAARFPWIRSTDSAKPIVYSIAGTRIWNTSRVPKYPLRPENYFYYEMSRDQLDLAEQNIRVFHQEAHNDDPNRLAIS